VWYDTAATIYLYRDTIFPTVAQIVGADRILFASDYGLLRQKRVINHIMRSNLNEEQKKHILGNNAKQLLSLCSSC
jgi:predicted TIM-barrel fold metal-dependent hydrolase